MLSVQRLNEVVKETFICNINNYCFRFNSPYPHSDFFKNCTPTDSGCPVYNIRIILFII